MTSHNIHNEAHLISVKHIPELIKKSIFIDKRENKRGGTDYYEYFIVGLKINGVDHTAKIVISVMDGKRYYDHILSKIEKGSLLNAIRLSDPSSQKEATLSHVKVTRLLEILQGISSKIIDENGSPRVYALAQTTLFTNFLMKAHRKRPAEMI